MKKYLALASATLALGASTGALAQALPNYGDFQSRSDNYRIGVQVLTNVGAPTPLQVQRGFGQSRLDDIGDYFNPAELSAALGAQYNQLSAVTAILDLKGTPAIASYAANSPILNVRFINPETGGTFVRQDGFSCSFNFNATQRQVAYNQFDDETDFDAPFGRGPDIFKCLAESDARNSPVNPLVGNPYSLQATMARNALDLAEGDSLIEQDPGANTAGDPLAIGVVFSGGNAGRFDMTRIDARISKGFRVFEGNRARLKIELPFNYTRIKGATSLSGQLAVGLEVPVIDQKWSLEPRVAYGLVYSPRLGSAGHMIQTSVASRYVINNAGPGKLLIGNMVGYAFTMKTPGKVNVNPDTKNWVLRNGLAYELPLKMPVAGRNTSVRASYTFTKYFGDDLFNNNFHEATISFGLRGREDTPKQFRDVIRLNLSTIQARGFSTYTAGIGFRF